MASWHGHSQPISRLQPSSLCTNLPADSGANMGDGVISTRILDNFLIENNILFSNHVTFNSNGQHREQGNDNNNYEDEEAINQVPVATSTAVNRQKNTLGNIR